MSHMKIDMVNMRWYIQACRAKLPFFQVAAITDASHTLYLRPWQVAISE